MKVGEETAMTEEQFTDEKVIAILREAETGVIKVHALCEKHGISEATLYKWCSQHAEQDLSLARRLQHLEDENQRLKALVADLTLRNQALKRVVSKKW